MNDCVRLAEGSLAPSHVPARSQQPQRPLLPLQGPDAGGSGSSRSGSFHTWGSPCIWLLLPSSLYSACPALCSSWPPFPVGLNPFLEFLCMHRFRVLLPSLEGCTDSPSCSRPPLSMHSAGPSRQGLHPAVFPVEFLSRCLLSHE